MTFDLKTLNDVFFRACSAGDERVMQWRDAAGKWQAITGRQLYQRVFAFAGVLAGWGIIKGDRVALLAENRWEWAVTDFAVMALGAVDVPLYPSLTAQQVADNFGGLRCADRRSVDRAAVRKSCRASAPDPD